MGRFKKFLSCFLSIVLLLTVMPPIEVFAYGPYNNWDIYKGSSSIASKVYSAEKTYMDNFDISKYHNIVHGQIIAGASNPSNFLYTDKNGGMASAWWISSYGPFLHYEQDKGNTQDSIDFSKVKFPYGSSRVYIAGGKYDASDAKSVADVTSAGYPILLNNDMSSFTYSVKSEISRINPKAIIMMGGTDVFNDIAGIGDKYNVIRVGGKDRQDTYNLLNTMSSSFYTDVRPDYNKGTYTLVVNDSFFPSSTKNAIENYLKKGDFDSAASMLLKQNQGSSSNVSSGTPAVVIGANNKFMKTYYIQSGALVFQYFGPQYFPPPPPPPSPVVSAGAMANPNSVTFDNADIPVSVNVSGSLFNATASDISYWMFKVKKSSDTQWTSSVVPVPSTSASANINMNILRSDVKANPYYQYFDVVAEAHLKNGNTITGTSSTSTKVTKPPKTVFIPPVADIIAPAQAKVNRDINIVNNSYDADGYIKSVEWTVSPSTGYTKNLNDYGGIMRFSTAGTYTISVKVTDDDNLTATSSKTIQVLPLVPPSVSFEMPAKSGLNIPVSVVNTSSTGDGDMKTYNWTVSSTDGVTQALTYDGGTLKFAKPGTYTVKLDMTNTDGFSGSATKQIVVENMPPVAAFDMPSTIYQGNTFDIINGSHDDDGSIKNYEWTLTPNSSLVGTLSGGSDIKDLYFDTEGTYTIKLKVTDDFGATNEVAKTITVNPAIPTANIQVTGDLKQNRKVTLISDNSTTPVSRYPIDVSKTEWQITPMTAGITSDDIKIDTTSPINNRDVLFKKAGDYTVKLRVYNGKHYSDWVEQTIHIDEDQKPVVNFNVSPKFTRDPNNSNKATISLYDASFSLDEDPIVKRVWKYKYDSNNDGNFADENWVIIDSTNKEFVNFDVANLGKYMIELEAQEDFGQPTINQFVTADDRQKNDTSTKPTAEKITEVDNVAPYIDFSVTPKQKADIVFTVGQTDSSKTTDLNNRINTYVKSLLTANNVDAQITSVQTQTTSVTSQDMGQILSNWTEWHGPSGEASWTYDSSNHLIRTTTNQWGISGYVNPNDMNLKDYTYEVDLGADIYGYHGIDTIGMSLHYQDINNHYVIMSAHNGDPGVERWGRNSGSDMNALVLMKRQNGQFYELASSPGGWVPGQYDHWKVETKGNNIKVYVNNVLRIDVTDSNPIDHGSFGPIAISQYTNAFKNLTVTSTVGKTLDEVLKEPAWRDDANHFLVNISDVPLKELSGQPTTPNLINTYNSTFSSGTYNWSTFNYTGNPSYITTAAGGYSGNNYMKIYGYGNGDSGAVLYNIPVKPNTNYKVSGMVNIPTAGTTNGNGLFTVVDSTNTSRLKDMNLPTGAGATSGWVQLGDTFNSGNNSYVSLRIDRGDMPEVDVTQLSINEDNGDATPFILSKLLSDSIDFDALGTSANQSQYQTLIAQNGGNGTFIDNTSMTTALDTLGQYILNKIKGNTSKTDKVAYVLLNQELDYETFYSDYENDPEYQRRWMYTHNANYFENSLGVVSYNNQWLSNAVTKFDKVGEYDVALQAQDNPVGTDTRFAEYRKWSDSAPTSMKVFVHRKPVAQFKVTATPSGANYVTSTSESSYDLDHMSATNKGIINKQWMWKKATDTTWTSGQLPSTLPVGYDYIVQLRVQDSDGPNGQGVWSDPTVQYVTTRNINIAPVAQFEIAPNPLPISKSLTLTDNSYDPNGDTIAQRQWTIVNEANSSTVYTGSTLPTNYAAYGLGKYKITLKVQDSPRTGLPLWSDPYSQELEVIADNRKPVANFNVTPNPVPVDVSVSYTDTSSDPDGDRIIAKEWQIMKSGTSTWVSIDQPPTDFTTYGVGTHQIRLRVKDQPSLPQLDALWSDWCTKSVTVTAGNQKPVARFTVSPNPVPADEPVTYTDTSYDPEGKAIASRHWRVTDNSSGKVYDYFDQLPPTVFEGTGWGANGDGVGTYTVALQVKDTTPNGLSPAQWSDWTTQNLVVEDPLRITALKMTSIVNPPLGTTAPISYPVGTPTKIKAGYRMTFAVNTNGGDKVDIKLYANGMPLTVHTDDGDTNTITKATVRKNAVTTFSFWTDKDLPKGTTLDMKVILTKTKADGSTKSLVDSILGYQFGTIVGSSKEDSSINLTQ